MSTPRRAKEPLFKRPRLLALATSPLRRLPEFLIIGAQKAATTSLFETLNGYPSVSMPGCKECHFFTRAWRPSLYYRGFFPLRGRRLAGKHKCVLLGEATPYYLFHPRAPLRAKRLLPNARLIVVLRDPVERAYSHYRHCVRFGLETLSFEEAIDAEPSRLDGLMEKLAASSFAESADHQHFSYVSRGRYAEQLSRWFQHFERSRIHITFAESLVADTAREIGAIERFLGLDPGPARELKQSNKGIEVGDMNPETRASLRALFQEPNRELAELLGVELPWPDSPSGHSVAS